MRLRKIDKIIINQRIKITHNNQQNKVWKSLKLDINVMISTGIESDDDDGDDWYWPQKFRIFNL